MSPALAYEKMKYSGIEWIADIPSHWNVRTLYKLASQVKNKNRDLEEQNLLSLSYGKIKRKDINSSDGLLPASFDGYNIIEAGDIVLRLTDLQNDKTSLRVGLATERGIITSAYVTLHPSFTYQSKYLYYLLHSFDIKKGFYGMGAGVRQGLTYGEVKELRVIIPSPSEVAAIAAFLDAQCAKIDEAIVEAKASIDEYRKWKASIIFEAVTKGVVPNTKMKDSGLEWVGEIPEDFEIIKIKHLGTYRNGLIYDPLDIVGENEGTLVLRASNVQNGKITLTDNVYVKSNINETLMVQKGDILICSRNGSRVLIGKSAIIEDDLVASFGAFMMIYRCECPKYMYFILNSNIFSYYLGTFLTATINQLTGSNFGNMKIVYCINQKTQNEIVDYLEHKCTAIDKIIVDKQMLIEDLETYKQSLIYETVTGKRKVVTHE